MPYRYFIQLAYDGSGFSGWQIQPNALTIQECLEQALQLISGYTAGLTGCGRTDSGVHARIYYAHFDPEKALHNPEQLRYKLNRFLSPAIAIQAIRPVHPGMHARFSAIRREYRYSIARGKDPFLYPYSHLYTGPLDVEVMNKGAAMLTEYSDFQCFSKVRTQVANFQCKLYQATWIDTGHVLEFRIEADRFLRNMVRAIVGTLLDVGRGRVDLDDLRSILESRDRRRAGVSVPAKGLTLWDVQYPLDCFSEKPLWFSYDSPDEIIGHHNTDSKFHQGSGHESDE